MKQQKQNGLTRRIDLLKNDFKEENQYLYSQVDYRLAERRYIKYILENEVKNDTRVNEI